MPAYHATAANYAVKSLWLSGFRTPSCPRGRESADRGFLYQPLIARFRLTTDEIVAARSATVLRPMKTRVRQLTTPNNS